MSGLRIDGMDANFKGPEQHAIAISNFSPMKQNAVCTATVKDLNLSALRTVIHQGWPENIRDLAMESGVIFNGGQELIPDSMTSDIRRQLHVFHQGIEKTCFLARESVYRIKMNDEIERVCRSCCLYVKSQDANPREPLHPQNVPSRPWQSIASDMFEVKGRQFLLSANRFSKHPVVDEMSMPISSHAVTHKIQMHMSLFGRVDDILTDNGPQYAGMD